jgi:hypothetical protein
MAPTHPASYDEQGASRDVRLKVESLRSVNDQMRLIASHRGHPAASHVLYPLVVHAAAAAAAGLALPRRVTLPSNKRLKVDLRWTQGRAEYEQCRDIIHCRGSSVATILLMGMRWYVSRGGDMMEMLKESGGRFYFYSEELAAIDE